MDTIIFSFVTIYFFSSKTFDFLPTDTKPDTRHKRRLFRVRHLFTMHRSIVASDSQLSLLFG